MTPDIDISKYEHRFSQKNKIGRLIWSICYYVLFLPFGTQVFKGWRRMLLRLFGAQLGKGAHV